MQLLKVPCSASLDALDRLAFGMPSMTLDKLSDNSSANRLLVQKGVSKEFTKKLVAKVTALKTGPGLDPSTTQGPLVNKSGVDKVKQHVDDAVSKGAKVEW